jgi:hypothetical protein
MCDKLNMCWKVRNAHACGLACGLCAIRAAELAKEICQRCYNGENKISKF